MLDKLLGYIHSNLDDHSSEKIIEQINILDETLDYYKKKYNVDKSLFWHIHYKILVKAIHFQDSQLDAAIISYSRKHELITIENLTVSSSKAENYNYSLVNILLAELSSVKHEHLERLLEHLLDAKISPDTIFLDGAEVLKLMYTSDNFLRYNNLSKILNQKIDFTPELQDFLHLFLNIKKNDKDYDDCQAIFRIKSEKLLLESSISETDKIRSFKV